jgi:hypothetical protein
MAEYIANAPFTRVQIDIAHDEDWHDEIPQLLEEDGTAVDLRNATLTLTVRPVLDHSVKIVELTSPSGGITLPDARFGRAVFSLPRAQVTAIPIGRWDQFLVLDQPDRTPRYREVWRGPLLVHPARV